MADIEKFLRENIDGVKAGTHAPYQAMEQVFIADVHGLITRSRLIELYAEIQAIPEVPLIPLQPTVTE